MQAALEALKTQPTITVAEATLILGVSEQTVRRHIKSEQIAVTRVGRSIRVLSAPLRTKLGV